MEADEEEDGDEEDEDEDEAGSDEEDEEEVCEVPLYFGYSVLSFDTLCLRIKSSLDEANKPFLVRWKKVSKRSIPQRSFPREDALAASKLIIPRKRHLQRPAFRTRTTRKTTVTKMSR